MLKTVCSLSAVLVLLSVGAPCLFSEPTSAEARGVRIDAYDPVPVPEASQKALRYYHSGNIIWGISTVSGLIIPALFLFTGFSARLRSLASRLGRGWFLTVGFYFIFFALISYLIDFPISYYSGFVREHAYELSNQSFAKWFGDSLKALGVGMVLGFLTLWIPYWLLRRSPQRWWLYTSVALIPFIFLLILITPVFIDPLFNDFVPMENKALEIRILDLASRAGIDGGRVYQVNKSVDTTTVNAYVTGFMNTKRIVLWDTIIEKLDEDELLFVMGHEMGHYVLGHIFRTVFILSAVVLVLLYLIHRLSGFLIVRYQGRFGFTSLSDVASLPLMILLLGILSLVADPVLLAVSRYHERQADQFGLEITQNNRAAATGFVKLQEENLSNPRPGQWFKLFRASHPPLGERIDFCNSYAPWRRGAPLQFRSRFRE
jgi:STE24 endopeptidase